MKTSDLCKAVPVAALLLAMNVPNAMAGATNRDENTSATPGEKATTTEEVSSPEHDRRKGTTQTDELDTPTSPADVDSSGASGSSGSGNNGSSNSEY
jgi:hypothetical protein